MLHVVKAWEEGDVIVMVGTPYRIHETPKGEPDARRLERTINQRQRDFLLYEWRFDLKTGKTRERVIDDVLNTEFPVINSAYQGRKNQFTYNVLFPRGGREEPRFPGIVKYDISTGGLPGRIQTLGGSREDLRFQGNELTAAGPWPPTDRRLHPDRRMQATISSKRT